MATDRLISVIIVNYNAGLWLTECVRSVLASSVPVIVYLVDNASTDQSLTHLQQAFGEDARLQITKHSQNLGFARAANSVLSHTQGDYLLFLNPDCLLAKDTLEHFLDVMDHHPQVGMAGGLVRNIDGSEQAGCRRSIPTPWRTLVHILYLDKLFPKAPKFILSSQPLPTHPVEIEGISGACMFVRRQALQMVGPLDENYFLHCEDLDWFMRFGALQWKILFIPEIEIIHAKGECSRRHPWRVLWHKHRGMIRFYRKFFRHQYPFLVFWGVMVAVWLRFVGLSMMTLIGQWRS